MSRLRTTVSRIAARATETPAENAHALDNLIDEQASDAPEDSHADDAQDDRPAPAPRGGVSVPPARTPVHPAQLELPVTKKTRAKRQTREVKGAAHETMTGPALRSAIKDLEATIKEVRLRHNTELDALRRKHTELNNQLFDLVR